MAGSVLPFFSIMFNLFASCIDVSFIVNNFYSVLFDAFDQFVPLRNSFKSECQPHKVRRLFSKKSTALKQLLAKYKSLALQ
jgi:hypothetical protein